MLLLIAYGNPLRQDDGAGLVLADFIEAAWQQQGAEVRRLTVQQLTPELALAVAAADVDAVVFADACRTPRAQTRPALQWRMVTSAGLSTPALGHNLSPDMVMAYARLLYGREPAAWVMTVPGLAFDHGEGLSPEVRRSLDRARDLLPSLLPRLSRE